MDQDLKKTKLFIKSMEVGAAGWVQGKRRDNPADLAPGPRVYLYILDRPGVEGWTWMCSCSVEGFVRISSDVWRETGKWRTYRNALSSCIKDAAEGQPRPDMQVGDSRLDWEEQLAMCASAYAGTTKTWELGNALKDGGHFIILNYRAKGADTGMLRPFAQPGRAGENLPILTITELIGMALDVMENDMKNHPEWFM